MTTLATALFTALVMGYPLHRAHVKLAAVESELKDAHALLRSIFKAAYNPKPARHLRSVDGGAS